MPDAEIEDFDIWTMRDRYAEKGDVHAAIDDVAHDLSPLLEMYERHGDGDAPYPPQFPKMEGEPLGSRPSVAGPAAQKRAQQSAERDARLRAAADQAKALTPERPRRPPKDMRDGV